MRRLFLLCGLVLALILAACAPSAGGSSTRALTAPCAPGSRPVVAVVSFSNAARSGDVTVVGVEDAATARLITMLKESGCYDVVEYGGRQAAEAAGAGYVITGTVTRATIAKPGASLFGVTLGATTAQVEVDVRATDTDTGAIVVSMRGAGEASNPNIATSRIPGGYVSISDPTVGPLLAQAADEAVTRVVVAIRGSF